MTIPNKSELELLIVEDRAVMIEIERRLLAELGYTTVDTAANGAEALERMRNKQYDLILSDWNMDKMSGYQLLKRVRSLPRTADIPFILVTAEAKPENILAAKAAGANGYLLKPFKIDGLQRVVEGVLMKSGFVAPEAKAAAPAVA